MSYILFRSPISDTEKQFLKKEHLPYEIIYRSPEDKITPSEWEKIEILYGNLLSVSELKMAPNLKWVHVPEPHSEALALDEIEKRENILISCTPEQNVRQMVEYVWAGILSFSKHLFDWKQKLSQKEIKSLKEKIWSLEKKIFLQVGCSIGCGRLGIEISKWAYNIGMKVIIVDEVKSFHPFAHKNLSFKDLHSVLPAADVICTSLPPKPKFNHWLTVKEIELLKEESILILLSPNNIISPQTLIQGIKKKKIKGALWDCDEKTAEELKNKYENLIVTPNIATLPHISDETAFRIFLLNLRAYMIGNLMEMKYLLNKKTALLGQNLNKEI